MTTVAADLSDIEFGARLIVSVRSRRRQLRIESQANLTCHDQLIEWRLLAGSD